MKAWQENVRFITDEASMFLDDHGRKVGWLGLAGLALALTSTYLLASPKDNRESLLEAIYPDGRPSFTSEVDKKLRDEVFDYFGFQPEMRTKLSRIPFVDRNTTTNGGGLYHSYNDILRPWIEVYSPQSEATLHEFSHAAYDILDDDDPTLGPRLEQIALDKAAKDNKGYFGLIMFGNKSTGGDWDGMWKNHNYTEMFASIASQYMGGVKMPFPEDLKPFYKSTFKYIDGKPKEEEK